MTRRLVGWLGFAALGAVVAGFVGLGGAGGWLYWNRVESRGEQTARAELAALAAEEIPKVLGYEYKTVERSLTETYPMFTSQYRREFEERVTKEIIPQAREKHLVNQVDIVGVGVLAAQRSTGSVLVFMNRTVTGKSKEKLYEGSRLRVDYQRVGDKWLISDIAPI